ncbi:dynein axonemal assembly factor 6 [Calliphora vicina]|uniref:dynein axonemal assembly factor 6 n=1 Tax=Calliphora vicina TaxID=7373 RepID=UPI00325C2C42
MSLFETPENLKLLQNLLNPPAAAEEESDLEDDQECLIKTSKLNPGAIGSAANLNNKKSSAHKKTKSPYDPLELDANSQKQPSTLEEWQQQHEQADKDILDSRKCPSYTLTYRQAVGTEDVFLQMGNRTNASASCEDLVVDILLTNDDTPSDKMHLTITEHEVVLVTAIYHLKLPLMHPVNVDRCRAKYQADHNKLTLTLRLQRELDFVNF